MVVTRQIHIQIQDFWWEIELQGLEKALDMVPGPKKLKNIQKKMSRFLRPCPPASKMRVQRFAIRKDILFPYCRLWKWGGGRGHGMSGEVDPKKKTRFCYRKIFWWRKTGWKTRTGSAGSDNSASWSCKRRVTVGFVQHWWIWIENPKIQGVNFLDSGSPKFSRRRPMPDLSPVGFKPNELRQRPSKPE